MTGADISGTRSSINEVVAYRKYQGYHDPPETHQSSSLGKGGLKR
jgi:hypothetical protein